VLKPFLPFFPVVLPRPRSSFFVALTSNLIPPTLEGFVPRQPFLFAASFHPASLPAAEPTDRPVPLSSSPPGGSLLWFCPKRPGELRFFPLSSTASFLSPGRFLSLFPPPHENLNYSLIVSIPRLFFFFRFFQNCFPLKGSSGSFFCYACLGDRFGFPKNSVSPFFCFEFANTPP